MNADQDPPRPPPPGLFQRLRQQRFSWLVLTVCYGLLCFGMTFWQLPTKAPTRVQLGYFFLAFSLFALGFFQFFYAIARFSPKAKQREQRRMQRPPPKTTRIWIQLLLGLLSLSILFFLT